MSKVLATAFLSVALASSAAGATPTQSDRKAPGDSKQYCLTFADQTGSHINRTECRTKKEWKQLGVDVDELSTNDSGHGASA